MPDSNRIGGPPFHSHRRYSSAAVARLKPTDGNDNADATDDNNCDGGDDVDDRDGVTTTTWAEYFPRHWNSGGGDDDDDGCWMAIDETSQSQCRCIRIAP